METVDVDPNTIRNEDGEMLAVWPVITRRQSLSRRGQPMQSERKVVIPALFAPVIEQAKAQNRQVRITYLVKMAPQTASDVRLI